VQRRVAELTSRAEADVQAYESAACTMLRALGIPLELRHSSTFEAMDGMLTVYMEETSGDGVRGKGPCV
jgi:hypothetical protein